MDLEANLQRFTQLKRLDSEQHADDPGTPRISDEPLADKLQRLLETVTRSELPRKFLPRGTRKPNGW